MCHVRNAKENKLLRQLRGFYIPNKPIGKSGRERIHFHIDLITEYKHASK